MLILQQLEILLDGMIQIVSHLHRGLVVLDESDQALVLGNDMEWMNGKKNDKKSVNSKREVTLYSHHAVEGEKDVGGVLPLAQCSSALGAEIDLRLASHPTVSLVKAVPTVHEMPQRLKVDADHGGHDVKRDAHLSGWSG